MSARNIAELEELFKHEMRLITLDSRRAADAFWSMADDEREQSKESGRLGTRVRLHNETHEASWFTRAFVHNKSNGDKKFHATHLPKSRGRNSHKYPQSTFSKSPAWEKDIATVVEERYSENRKKAQLLMEMRRLLKQYKKLSSDD